MQEAAPGMAGDPEILGDRELRKHALDLQGALDAEPADLVRLESGDVAPVEEHAAAVGGQQARDQIEERGLAGAVRTDDRVQLRPGEAEAQVVDRGQAAEALGQPFACAGSARSWLGPQLGLRRAGAPRRSAMRASHSFHNPTTPLGAKITTRMATDADDQRVVLPVGRHDLAHDDEQASCPTIGPSSVPAPPTIAHTTASPDTW